MVYLDNAATTKVSPEVMEAMVPYFSEMYGNPASIHSAGLTAAKAVETAREQVAKPIGADPGNIIFTSGGSEANTLAIMGLAEYLQSVGKTHIVTTQVEHHSVLNAMNRMKHGFDVTFLPVDLDGCLPISSVEKAIGPKTGLVSVMAVNNETGNQYDISSIGAICHQKGALFHTDCVQAYCGVNIDVNRMNIDFLSASGHKIHAPKGIGFLYAGRKELLRPIIFGGSQEDGLRGGTHNVPYIVGMGRAAEVAYHAWLDDPYWYGRKTMELWRLIRPIYGAHVNGAIAQNSKTLNIRFDGVDGETLLMLLDSKGVEVSAGSACTAHYAEPSHVLTAMGLTKDEARSSIRLSVSKYTTDDELEFSAKMVTESVKELREGFSNDGK